MSTDANNTFAQINFQNFNREHSSINENTENKGLTGVSRTPDEVINKMTSSLSRDEEILVHIATSSDMTAMTAQRFSVYLTALCIVSFVIAVIITFARIYFWTKKSPRFKILIWIVWFVTIAIIGMYFFYQQLLKIQFV